MADPAISDPETVSSLCVDCGLCCSGAIYDHANHEADEDALVRSLGMKLIPVKDGQEQAIALPCPQLDGSACSVYGQRRPKICGSFFCKLARALDAGETDFAAASSKVASAKVLLEQIEPFLEPGETINAARRRWREQSGEEWRKSPASARFHLLMTSLNLLLDRHFRREGQQYLTFEMGE